ncbi:myb-like domain, Myb/SANT-like DNA-binding domain protein [Artemisia annua]|uniref:Myb-like domain, Myb/SANT-like DNA-binding domain protein n=1 Tax=Artemisia annua TaxID=35608 RepID=A0A2U1M837_ARTAN|nr:myb-like domain, Myb/SANT-like DNA-binding domain protein [Artemisia annua]
MLKYEDVQVRKGKSKADKKSWTAIEEVALAKAWMHISTCQRVGIEQGRDKFWERIQEHFATTIVGTKRTHHSLNTKWKNMNRAMGIFNGLYIQQYTNYVIVQAALGVLGELRNETTFNTKKPRSDTILESIGTLIYKELLTNEPDVQMVAIIQLMMDNMPAQSYNWIEKPKGQKRAEMTLLNPKGFAKSTMTCNRSPQA